jgi:hypothetical protein
LYNLGDSIVVCPQFTAAVDLAIVLKNQRHLQVLAIDRNRLGPKGALDCFDVDVVASDFPNVKLQVLLLVPMSTRLYPVRTR